MIMSNHKNIFGAHSHVVPMMTSNMNHNNAMRNTKPAPNMKVQQTSVDKNKETIPTSNIKTTQDQVTLLRNKFVEAFQNKLRSNSTLYDQLVKHFSTLKGTQLSIAYQALTQCANMIEPSLRELSSIIFQPDLAKVFYQKGEVIQSYNTLVATLLSVHPSYTTQVAKLITDNFKPVSEFELTKIQTSKSIPNLSRELLQTLEQVKYDNTHDLLSLVIKKTPQNVLIISKKLDSDYPHHTQPLSYHRSYVTNLLRLTEYAPQYLNQVFQIVVQQLIKLDSEIKIPEPRDEDDDEDDEDDDEEDDEEHITLELDDVPKDAPEEHRQVVLAEKLDTIMYIILDFIKKGSTQPVKIQTLFQSMMRQFHSFVVNTYQLHSIQFLMFYLCSFNEEYLNTFVQFLLTKVFDQTVHQEVRKCCAAYLSGFISRAKYCPVKTVTAMLSQMLGWLEQYVTTFEKTVTYLDVESHSIFYSLCQGVFYVLCYKIHDMMKTEAGVYFLQNEAPLVKVARSKFNPLKIIALDVANEVTRAFEHYFFSFAVEFEQIIDRNKNVMVPMKGSYGGVNYLENNFFPFDPVLLRQSNQFILPLYQSWEGGVIYQNRQQQQQQQHMDSGQDDSDYLYNESRGTRSRNNSVTNDRAKMFINASLNNGTPSKSNMLSTSYTSRSSNSNKMGTSYMDEDIFSENGDDDDSDSMLSDSGDDDDDDDDDLSSGGEEEEDDDVHNNISQSIAIKGSMSRRSNIRGRSVEDKSLFVEDAPYGWDYDSSFMNGSGVTEIPVPYGWEYDVGNSSPASSQDELY